MSIYLGDKLLAGASEKTTILGFDLFDHKWSDHILNDISWLRADTFSWQSGEVYKSAYEHLVDDLNGTTSATETIGSQTITYYLATDKHKIVLPDQESAVQAIYEETGVAWYYIVDQANQRFKLPRSSHGNIVEKYQNGTDWYRVWSDGWCEQGGQTANVNMGNAITVSFKKSFKDTNYVALCKGTIVSTDDAWFETGVSSFKPESFVINNGRYTGSGTDTLYYKWRACGYISDVRENDQYKYLYFYVGNYTKSAIEQTAGLNAELFNGKVDLDGHNATFAHIVETYQNDTSWYRVYSDGWCEQGGSLNNTSGSDGSITFLKQMANTNYTAFIQTYNSGGYVLLLKNKTTTGFSYSGNVGKDVWLVCGYKA